MATEVIKHQVNQEHRKQIPAAKDFIATLEARSYISVIVFKTNIRNTYWLSGIFLPN